MRDQSDQIAGALLRAAPPAAGTLWGRVLDMPLQDWLTALLIVYTVMQIIALAHSSFAKDRRKRRGRDPRERDEASK